MARITALWLLLCAWPNPTALAQTAPVHAPDGDSGANFIASIFVPSFENVPFSATVTTEETRPRPDGSSGLSVNHRLLVRDSVGRIFQERRMIAPPGSPAESQLTSTEIADPATRSLTVCDTNRHVCEIRAYRPMTTWVLPPAGLFANGSGNLVRQDLGQQTVAGIELVGTRETETLSDSGQSVQVTKEFWYSPQLGINLVTERWDPRSRRTERFTVTDIVLGEPDRSLFSLPAGARIIDYRDYRPAPPR